jgi:hypothetical protein
MAVEDIVTRVQKLFEDEQANWCDKGYILGWLQMYNEDLESYLENLDLSYDTQVVVITGVPANTTDLSTYQAATGPLANMVVPIALEWKLTTDNQLQWRPINRVDKVVDTDQSLDAGPVSSNIIGILSYEWRGGIVFISPSSVAVDVRARAEMLPSVVNTDNSAYIKGMTNVLAYGISVMIADSRGGVGNAKLSLKFSDRHQKALDVLVDRLVKNEQITPRRMGGRRSKWPGPLYRLPMG